MKAPEFEGIATSIEADNWLTDIQVILDFMGLTEQEKVLCASFVLKKDAQHWWMTVQMRRNVTTMSWQDFMIEFRAMYFNREILTTQQNEFNSFRQGSMTVLEAVKKFEQLARLCPELVPNETEKVRKMMKMLRTDIAKQVSAGSNPPTLVSDCISQAIRAEYRINQDKEARIQILKAKKENKDATKQLQPRQNLKLHSKGQTSNSAQKIQTIRKEQEEKECYKSRSTRKLPSKENQSSPSKKIEGLSIAQERLEAPKPQTWNFAYAKEDVEAGTSSVATDLCAILRMEFLGKDNAKMDCRKRGVTSSPLG
ncbi:hypothetical protein TIFTF001_051861 [Ficus carica]|nr:hypothetical protein TIFTF001_051861 [Ficus carica]